MTDLLWGVASVLAFMIGFPIGRSWKRHSTPKHEHVWGNWEPKSNVYVKQRQTSLDLRLGKPCVGTYRDAQQRECLGCGFIQRQEVG